MVSVYGHLVRAQARAQASYRASFALELVASAVFLGADLLTVLVLFRVTAALGGFSVAEVLLMFGLSASGFAVADLVVGNVERLRVYVRTGLLDAVLVRPLGVLPQLLALDFALRRIGRLLYAFVLYGVALGYADLVWSPDRIVLAMLAPLTGAVLFSAVFVASASVAFWWIDSGELANTVTYGGRDLTSYPINVYSGWFRRVFAYGMGFAFVAYHPALYLLDKPDPLGMPRATAWASPLVAVAAVGVAALVWRIGVRQYRSTGS